MVARRRTTVLALLALATLGTLGESVAAERPDSSEFLERRWRMIGPVRASRTMAGTGVPSQPYLFESGGVTGGVGVRAD